MAASYGKFPALEKTEHAPFFPAPPRITTGKPKATGKDWVAVLLTDKKNCPMVDC